MFMTRSRLLATLLVATAACQPAASPGLTDADRTAIKEMDASFTKMAMAADYAGLVKMFYADDAMFMAPNAPAASGHDAIQAALASFPPLSDFTITTEELDGSANLAFARGTYALTMTPPGGAPIQDRGKTIVIYRKQADGSWKASRDIFNSDIPLPAPEPAKPAK